MLFCLFIISAVVMKSRFERIINLTSKHSQLNHHIIKQIYLLLDFVKNNSNFSAVQRLSFSSKQLLRDIIRVFKYISEKDLVSIEWALNQKSFNTAIRIVTRETTNFAKWLEKRRKIFEQARSSSINEKTKTSRISQFIKSIISKTFFRNKKSSRELIKVSFKLSKNMSSKVQSIKIFLRKNKKINDCSIQEHWSFICWECQKVIKIIKSFQNFSESFQNFAESFQNFSKSSQNFTELLKNIYFTIWKNSKRNFESHIKEAEKSSFKSV